MTRAAVILTMALACSACGSYFADIQSTPRITSGDVKRSGVRITDEQQFASGIVPEAPRSWQPGKQWRVSDNRISLVFGLPEPQPLAGTTITLKSLKPVSSVTGTDVMELVFNDPAGRLYTYTTDVAVADWAQRVSLPVPFAVELDPVAHADSLMRGNTYYITNSLWYDRAGKAIEGRRHIAVRVDSVAAGTDNLPLRVYFTPSDKSAPASSVYMTFGEGPAAVRNFDRMFSFTDPRRRYPNISDENWNRITRSQIAQGMTRDEARLALGTPVQVERGATRGGLQMENWSYGNGVYLLFEDGILTKFRK